MQLPKELQDILYRTLTGQLTDRFGDPLANDRFYRAEDARRVANAIGRAAIRWAVVQGEEQP